MGGAFLFMFGGAPCPPGPQRCHQFWPCSQMAPEEAGALGEMAGDEAGLRAAALGWAQRGASGDLLRVPGPGPLLPCAVGLWCVGTPGRGLPAGPGMPTSPLTSVLTCMLTPALTSVR